MTRTIDEHRRLALELASELRRLADAALVADADQVVRATVYARRVALELAASPARRR